MKVVTALEHYNPIKSKTEEVCVFLAGGITGCYKWQNEIIQMLEKKANPEALCIFNPRRDNFPIDDPNASYYQIKWEYEMLEKADIFSMYFCAGDREQPICMYELGRNIVRMQDRFPEDWQHRIIITVEEGYKRKQDVVIQTFLATSGRCSVTSFVSPKLNMVYHADTIYEAHLKIKNSHIL